MTNHHTCDSGLEHQIQQFADSEILRAILDQGVDPKEFQRQCETQLRDAERGSVQDYLAESDNLVLLHDQVRARREKACILFLGFKRFESSL